VIAHEVGHHVQNLLGISGKVDEMRGRVSKVEYNRLSVRWSCRPTAWPASGPTMPRMQARSWSRAMSRSHECRGQIGDDALQRAQTGQVVPDSFTHGSSAQRQRWFMTGLKSGSVNSCDTFSAASL
jgi:predicted metalloprotease